MSSYLDKVNFPEDVKRLSLEELQGLAGDIRQELINKLATNGGHLGPNLGVVELTIALHHVFNTPVDKFVWDVSHQTYVHKILTGRKDRFHTIRTTGGLNGFSLRTESEHDCYGAGHAGTALSAALGMAAARDRVQGKEHIVTIFGDAALTNGISFEALNNITNTTQRFIGILNDNEWSIAKNVGAIATYLNKLITNSSYNRVQKYLGHWLKKMPKGDLALQLGHKYQELLKGTVTEVTLVPNEDTVDSDGRGGYGNSLIFEEMGLRYVGPIDGHDMGLLISSLMYAKECDTPIVLHVLTKKGKGYEAALAHPEKFHGTGPYDIATGSSVGKKGDAPPNYQDVFGDTMVRLCREKSNMIGITAAMPSGTGLKALEKAMPERYYDVGIAEEHAVLFAAGMATMGTYPVVAIYSTFLQRAYDCIVHDVALQDLPVMFCMDRAGLSANDGPTHHGLFDIGYLSCVPNIIAMAPSNEDELVDMMFTAASLPHPTFIRYPRGAAEGVPIKPKAEILEVGKAQVVRDFAENGSPKVALFGLGNFLGMARQAAEILVQSGIDAAVINPRFTKPIDEELTARYGAAADVVVTLEDHVLAGGYGSLVASLLADRNLQPTLIRLGWPDRFIEHASTVEYLREKHGLTLERLMANLEKALGISMNQKAKAAFA